MTPGPGRTGGQSNLFFFERRSSGGRTSGSQRSTVFATHCLARFACILLPSVVADMADGDAQTTLPCGFAAFCTDEFSLRMWGRRASILEPNCTPAEKLLDVMDVADLLRAARESLQIVGGTAPGNTTKIVSPQPRKIRGATTEFYRNSTLVLTSLERKVPRIAAWARSFLRAFGLPCEVALYLTPQGSQAASLHNDRDDIFVVQVWGQTTWDVWDLPTGDTSAANLPRELADVTLAAAPFLAHTVSAASLDLAKAPREDDDDEPAAAEPTLKAQLKPGAMLYIPRGSLHVTSTAGMDSGTSAHLEIAVPTQSFSFANAAYYAAADHSIKEAMRGAGGVTRFRLALMRWADHARDGVSFRQSLPFGWVRRALGAFDHPCGVGGLGDEPRPAGAVSEEAREVVRGALESLMSRVLQEPPPQRLQATVGPAGEATPSWPQTPPPRVPTSPRTVWRLPDSALLAAAGEMARHLDAIELELSSDSVAAHRIAMANQTHHRTTMSGEAEVMGKSSPQAKNEAILVLPADLHIAYVAWGVDGHGGGELLARFAWCGRGAAGAAKARWPAAVLPMLRAVAASRSRLLHLSLLGVGGDSGGSSGETGGEGRWWQPIAADAAMGKDIVPALIFALALEQLPLQPGIRLLPVAPSARGAPDALGAASPSSSSIADSASGTYIRNPDC